MSEDSGVMRCIRRRGEMCIRERVWWVMQGQESGGTDKQKAQRADVFMLIGNDPHDHGMALRGRTAHWAPFHTLRATLHCQCSVQGRTQRVKRSAMGRTRIHISEPTINLGTAQADS